MLNTLLAEQLATSQVETTVQGGVPQVAAGSVKTTVIALDRRWADLEKTLMAACSQRPIVLLVDEAHAINKIDTGLYQEFLNVAQEVAGKAPFLLALVGTPDLPAALSAVGSTFIERAQSVGIGLLECSEAEAAIREPLAKDAIQIDAEALAFAVEDGQRYPYFLQLWGKALWNTAMTVGKERLTMDDLESTRQTPQADKLGFYARRYDELIKNHRIKAAALAVANAFKDADSCHPERLLGAIEEALAPLLQAGEALDEAASQQFKALQHLGFAWRNPRETVLRPGIPSLMDFALAQSQQAQASAP